MQMDRTIPPLIKRIESIEMPSAAVVDHVGIVPVRTVPSENEDWTAIDLVFNAGTGEEEKPLVSATCSGMMNEGTETRSADQIAEIKDFYGAKLYSSVGKDTATVGLLCLNSHLEVMVPILADIILNPSFPEKEFLSYVKRAKAALTINLERVEMLCRLEFSRRYFGQSKYADNFQPDDYEKLTRDDVNDFFRDRYGLNEAHIVVSGGRVDPAIRLLKADLNRFNQSSFRRELTSLKPEKGLEIKKRSDSLQSAIRFGGPAVSREHPDFVALYAANTILGGYFGSRLMQNLREEKGFTYGVGSVIQLHRDHSFLTISTQVGYQHTMSAVEEIEKEMIQLGENPPTVEELELVKNYIAGSLVKSCDGTSNRVGVLKTMVLHNLDSNYFQRFLSELYELTPSDVMAAAQKYFNHHQFTKTVVGRLP